MLAQAHLLIRLLDLRFEWRIEGGCLLHLCRGFVDEIFEHCSLLLFDFLFVTGNKGFVLGLLFIAIFVGFAPLGEVLDLKLPDALIAIVADMLGTIWVMSK